MTTKSKNKLNELRVKSKTENLSVIRDFVSEKALDAGLPMATVENIMLAVDEACTNIIKHAYKSSPEGKIILNIDYDEKKFTITIIDYGKSFEPNSVPLPNLQKYYREHKVGGLGIYLMKSLMDDVKYTSVPGKYNQVLLSKNINGS
ncbi:MAG: ATP-binding protein [Ignavibacteriaceae bacterium]|nr:ATP-binding protein [Ignavibacteriaceae bacterium]MCW8960758.1 ATP-binding protein [Ignavibacteriaceae bacterium]MCW9094444.1 ATP-binding protein [Ignavibacteriaceae bacterium]